MRNAERSLYCCRFTCRQLRFNTPIGLHVKNTKMIATNSSHSLNRKALGLGLIQIVIVNKRL